MVHARDPAPQRVLCHPSTCTHTSSRKEKGKTRINLARAIVRIHDKQLSRLLFKEAHLEKHRSRYYVGVIGEPLNGFMRINELAGKRYLRMF